MHSYWPATHSRTHPYLQALGIDITNEVKSLKLDIRDEFKSLKLDIRDEFKSLKLDIRDVGRDVKADISRVSDRQRDTHTLLTAVVTVMANKFDASLLDSCLSHPQTNCKMPLPTS